MAVDHLSLATCRGAFFEGVAAGAARQRDLYLPLDIGQLSLAYLGRTQAEREMQVVAVAEKAGLLRSRVAHADRAFPPSLSLPACCQRVHDGKAASLAWASSLASRPSHGSLLHRPPLSPSPSTRLIPPSHPLPLAMAAAPARRRQIPRTAESEGHTTLDAIDFEHDDVRRWLFLSPVAAAVAVTARSRQR